MFKDITGLFFSKWSPGIQHILLAIRFGSLSISDLSPLLDKGAEIPEKENLKVENREAFLSIKSKVTI